VARIALYPDPLLAQILAATYPINSAARLVDQHILTGQALANAITETAAVGSSVQALLPFPRAGHDASDMNWTRNWERIPDAAAGRHGSDAKGTPEGAAIRVPADQSPDRGRRGPYITIMPVDPAFSSFRIMTRPSSSFRRGLIFHRRAIGSISRW